MSSITEGHRGMEERLEDVGNDAPATNSSNHGRSEGHGTRPLTVKNTWKVEAAMKDKQDGSKASSSVWLVVVKWITMVCMMMLLLACLVTAKLSLLTLSSQLYLHMPALGEQQSTQWSRYTAQYILLYLYLTIPAGLMLLRAVWYGLLDKTVPWPKAKAIMLAIFIAVLESFGLCLMVYSVLGRYQSPVSLLLLAAVLVVPVANVFVTDYVKHPTEAVPGLACVLAVVGLICTLLGTVGVWVLLALPTHTRDSNLWHPAVAMVCVCVAWVPSLQRYISFRAPRPKTRRVGTYYGTFSHSNVSHEAEDTTPLISTTTTTTSAATTASAAPTTPTEPTTTAAPTQTRIRSDDLSTNAAWKTSFIQNGCRLLAVFVFSALLFMVDSGRPPADVVTTQVHMAFLQAWDLRSFVDNNASWLAFGLGLGFSLLAYVLAFAACHMNMAKVALAPPLLVALPLTLVVLTMTPVCQTFLPSNMCSWDKDYNMWLVPTAVCLVLGHALVFCWYLFHADHVLLVQECRVYYVPGYNTVSLESWLTVNLRPTVSETRSRRRNKNPKVFICTTMYREEEEEMKQLLESIHYINEAQAQGDRYFESHIIFDNGVRQREPTEFALRLISLLEDTLGIGSEACTKILTPYGLKLSWNLPGPSGHQMPFNIHLKDNLLVKNKKRWSQVMYMSYVLDFLTEEDDEAFILTTDADVKFTPDSVEALLDLMTRDSSIGAVCARTHPMGGGPLVWYQVFEYAIGHWFQKTAEHILGSVLCAPGCFSVYRCRALADILPKYAKRVESAFDFLTKDMGEDRWLCTLLVQSGWRIEYCAASENSTNCPGNFDEFFKQRRRWIASTLANLMLIVQEWKYVLLLNHRVSLIFLVYQGLLLFSTLIGPSTVILVVSGGLSYAWTVNGVAIVVVQLLASLTFCVICIYTSQKTQLTVAKLYTFVYALVMTVVAVGTAGQIVDDLTTPSPETVAPSTLSPTSATTVHPNQHISVDLPMSVTTLYFASLGVIFISAGILHLPECYCLIHGVWYLLCLPSGYLVLTLYSICNITDSSWGTREQSSAMSAMKKMPWQSRLKEIFFQVFFCCKGKVGEQSSSSVEVGVQTVMARTRSSSLPYSEEAGPPASLTGCEDYLGATTGLRSIDDEDLLPDMDKYPDKAEPVPVEEWLLPEMRGRYVELFKKHGFDSTLFIAGMTEMDLRRIGITLKGHLRYLMDQIALIPAFEIEYKVPINADEWLKDIGLPMYRKNFRRNHIQQPKEMEILKSMGRREIEQELGITKDGHIKRLQYAITMLRDPTDAQQRAIRMRQVIDEVPIYNLAVINIGENDFWQSLRRKCLEPDLEAFGLEEEVKAKLSVLRNEWLMTLGVSNLLWLILITTLASNATLTVLRANPMSLVFLTVFGFVIVLQFLTMLVHRVNTLSHFLARAPYRCGRPMQSMWTFMGRSGQDVENLEDTVDITAVRQAQRDAERAWNRVVKPQKRHRKALDKAQLQEEQQQQETELSCASEMTALL